MADKKSNPNWFLINIAHQSITRIKGRDYAPNAHEIQERINKLMTTMQMKKIIVIISMIVWSCVDGTESKPKKVVWTPVIVKKKYVENETTKDLLFDTGNWHSVNHIIVDNNNAIWEDVRKNVFILCDVGDTLWVSNDGFKQLQLTKQ